MFIFEAGKAMRSTNTCVKKYFQIKKSTAFFSFLPMNFKFLNFLETVFKKISKRYKQIQKFIAYLYKIFITTKFLTTKFIKLQGTNLFWPTVSIIPNCSTNKLISAFREKSTMFEQKSSIGSG